MSGDRCQHTWIPTASIPFCSRCGKSPTASPSQVETWQGCRRRHGYSRIRERTENKLAAYGDRCHTIVEGWLRDHIPPDATTPEGRTMLPGLALLPMPRTPGLVVEHRATPTMLGVAWDMRLDYLFGYVPQTVVVYADHKTTGDIAKYAKTPEVLATTDPQGIAYGNWVVNEFNVPRAIGQWTYYQRDARVKPRPVVFHVERKELAARFEQLHYEYVLPMVRSRVHPPEELPRDGLSNGYCTKYGPCPYIDECHAGVTPVERAAAAITMLRRANTPARETEPMTAVPPSLLSALNTNAIPGVGPLPPMPGAAVALAPDLEAWVASCPAEHQAAARQQAEAEMVKRAPAAPAAAPVAVPVVAPVAVPVALPVAGPVTGPVVTSPSPAVVQASAPADSGEAKRGRGRPPKSEALQLLQACASGGCSIELARSYLDLAAEVSR